MTLPAVAEDPTAGSSQAEEREDRQDDDDKAHQIDYAIHCHVLPWHTRGGETPNARSKAVSDKCQPLKVGSDADAHRALAAKTITVVVPYRAPDGDDQLLAVNVRARGGRAMAEV